VKEPLLAPIVYTSPLYHKNSGRVLCDTSCSEYPGIGFSVLRTIRRVVSENYPVDDTYLGKLQHRKYGGEDFYRI